MLEQGTMLLCEHCLNYLVAQGYIKYVYSETLDLDDMEQAFADGELERVFNCEWCEDFDTLHKAVLC